MFRFLVWFARRLGAGYPPGGEPVRVVRDFPGRLVTVRLPDGRLVEAEHLAGGGAGYSPRQPALSVVDRPGAPPPPRRRPPSGGSRWLRWSVLLVVAVFFRRIVAWALLAVLSGLLHLFGASVGLPHVTFGWPWSPGSASSSSTLVGPLVLQRIQGIDRPALGSATFDFRFTHSVSKPMGFLPCWYSATFAAVGHASATVDLNPGPSWWKPAAGHYGLRVLSQPSGSAPGRVAVTMALPLPQLPASVHDVSVDNTLSVPVSSDHSWTYPGLACGVLIKPQFSPSVLYSQAQREAFTQATTVGGVTQPLIAAAEREASTIVGGNFVGPTLNALHYQVSRFTVRWVAPITPNG
ncbi:MAG TPA: hypothetical protein VGD91_04395 [Trebonia sp.]